MSILCCKRLDFSLTHYGRHLTIDWGIWLMFDDLRDLYQEVIFDHNRNPRNFRVMDDADRKVEGFNPLCGDRLILLPGTRWMPL